VIRPHRFIAGMINLCPKLGLFSIAFEAFPGLVLLQVVFACCVQDWRLLAAVACLGGRNTVIPSRAARFAGRFGGLLQRGRSFEGSIRPWRGSRRDSPGAPGYAGNNLRANPDYQEISF
jgi:hypothetical protein